MLLALTSVFRLTGFRILNARFIVKTSQKYVFKFHKLHKSCRQGLQPTTLEFVIFSQDKDVCVVSVLDEYSNMPSTISSWLKKVLKSPGINIS